MNDLINVNVMGKRAGNVNVGKIQKSELPHSHIIFILKEQDILRTAQELFFKKINMADT